MDGLKVFYVTYTDPEVGEKEVFRCWAEDVAHAAEQCESSYPDATIDLVETEIEYGDRSFT